VVGDMIALDGLPGVAQVAIQGGRHVARQIKARLAGKSDKDPTRRKARRSGLQVPRQGQYGDDLALQRGGQHRGSGSAGSPPG